MDKLGKHLILISIRDNEAPLSFIKASFEEVSRLASDTVKDLVDRERLCWLIGDATMNNLFGQITKNSRVRARSKQGNDNLSDSIPVIGENMNEEKSSPAKRRRKGKTKTPNQRWRSCKRNLRVPEDIQMVNVIGPYGTDRSFNFTWILTGDYNSNADGSWLMEDTIHSDSRQFLSISDFLFSSI